MGANISMRLSDEFMEPVSRNAYYTLHFHLIHQFQNFRRRDRRHSGISELITSLSFLC